MIQRGSSTNWILVYEEIKFESYHQIIQKTKHLAKLVLQVHDEVICEVPHAALEEVKVEVVDIMNSAFEMRVPLAVNVATGSTWAAAKG